MKQNALDEFKGKNPFKVPDGYFEGLTAQIMAQIPEESRKEAKVIPLRDKIRPWLYVAAVFVGVLICLRIVMGPYLQDTDNRDDVLYLQALVTGEELQVISEDDMDYLEFMENQYFDRLFAEEIDVFTDETE